MAWLEERQVISVQGLMSACESSDSCQWALGLARETADNNWYSSAMTVNI